MKSVNVRISAAIPFTKAKMPFSSRNLYYLKINAYTILPVFLHLDEQHGHVQWMTEDILHSVIEDMRPLSVSTLSLVCDTLTRYAKMI